MPRQYTGVSPEVRFWNRANKSGECWIWKGYTDPDGYGRFIVGDPPKTKRAHRHAYELVYGAIPDGMLVCHRCDNPSCVRPDHLFLGTDKDNAEDRGLKGRTAKGDRHGRRLHPERFEGQRK